MPLLLVQQRTTDFDRWRASFRDLADDRSRSGLATMMVARSAEEPDEVFVLFDVADPELIADHVLSPALVDAHGRGRVVPGTTKITLLNPDS